jgi:hypothetical protein
MFVGPRYLDPDTVEVTHRLDCEPPVGTKPSRQRRVRPRLKLCPGRSFSSTPTTGTRRSFPASHILFLWAGV